MLLDITVLSQTVKASNLVPISVVAAIYVGCTLAISKLYLIQACKFLRGKNGAGDFCFTSKSGQALLRIAGLVYALYINDGTLFLVIALDFVGRWIEIAAAYLAYRRRTRLGPGTAAEN